MRQIFERPPRYEQILRTFPAAAGKAILFAYGDLIYNPSRIEVPPALIAHEEVHGRRQIAYEGGPDAWWDDYMALAQFRFTEELLAHQAEYAYHLAHDNRAARRRALVQIAEKLSSPLYGSMTNKKTAKDLIWQGSTAAQFVTTQKPSAQAQSGSTPANTEKSAVTA